MGVDRFQQITGAPVVEEKDALPYTPEGSGPEFIRAGAALGDAVRKALTHVVDQQVGKKIHRLIG